MADLGGENGMVGRKSHSGSRIVEEFKPQSAWVDDANCHYLLVDLPEFNKDEVKIETDSIDHVTIGGRKVRENNYIYFEQAFKVPENSDIDQTTGRLEGGILTVTVPKRVMASAEAEAKGEETALHEQDSVKESCHEGEEHDEQPEKEARARKSGREYCYSDCDENIEKRGAVRSIFRSAMKMLNKNKEILITAVLAFSLGVFVSHKFETASRDTTHPSMI